MKPREFDELVRQQFDQNDFAYNPKNWDQLAEQLDGRAKKRSMIMWLWMPAAGMAASVALAIGVTTLLRLGGPATEGNTTAYTHTSEFVNRQPVHEAVAIADLQTAAIPVPHSIDAVPYKHKQVSKQVVKTPVAGNNIGISMNNVLNGSQPVQRTQASDAISLAVAPHSTIAQPVKPAPTKPKKEVEKPGYTTFREEAVAAVKAPAKFSIILSGGVNQGSHTSGYMAGATVRRMLNDKVYVEGDVFFATSDNTQKTQYMSYDNAPGAGLPTTAAKVGTSAKLSKVESGKPTTVATPEGVIKTQDISYNLYYAQVTPSIGYKIMKRMSVGLGPDFQKMLVDNRPAVSTVDRGTIQVAPTFDVGFMGKTEYALTNKVKAAVSYRKGVNSIISMSDKFIDRDYLQFQVKCTIFNK